MVKSGGFAETLKILSAHAERVLLKKFTQRTASSGRLALGIRSAVAPHADGRAPRTGRCRGDQVPMWNVREITSSCCSLVSLMKFTA